MKNKKQIKLILTSMAIVMSIFGIRKIIRNNKKKEETQQQKRNYIKLKKQIQQLSEIEENPQIKRDWIKPNNLSIIGEPGYGINIALIENFYQTIEEETNSQFFLFDGSSYDNNQLYKVLKAKDILGYLPILYKEKPLEENNEFVLDLFEKCLNKKLSKIMTDLIKKSIRITINQDKIEYNWMDLKNTMFEFAKNKEVSKRQEVSFTKIINNIDNLLKKKDKNFSVSDFNNHIVVFDLTGTDQKIATIILTDVIFNLQKNKFRYKYIYYKDAENVIKNNDFFYKYFSTSRPKGISMNLAIHNIQGLDILRLNSSFIMLLHIKNMKKEIFGLSEDEQEFLNNALPGIGILIDIPKNEHKKISFTHNKNNKIDATLE